MLRGAKPRRERLQPPPEVRRKPRLPSPPHSAMLFGDLPSLHRNFGGYSVHDVSAGVDAPHCDVVMKALSIRGRWIVRVNVSSPQRHVRGLARACGHV